MRYLIILFCIFLSSCYTFNKIERKEEVNLNDTPPISVKFEDLDTNGDNNISTVEFNDYKESTKKGLVDPNVDYARPLIISIILLGSILLFCFIPKLCRVSKVIIDKGGKKTKDWWIKRCSKK